MKFTVVGNQISCSRKIRSDKNNDTYRKVVNFDAHLDTVATHVSARLTSQEIEQLELFLADRNRIRANDSEQNMLDVLPGLLTEAAEILNSGDSMNDTVFEQLSEAVAAFSAALQKVKRVSGGQPALLKGMRKSQAQRERLLAIKEDLSRL